MFKAPDQDALSLMSDIGVLAGTPQHLHPPLLDPVPSRVQQGLGHLEILYRLEEPEEADAGVVIFVEAEVDGRGYGSHQLGIAPGQEVGDLSTSMIGMR